MIDVKRTWIVSFPRCGQHLVVRGLQWVFPDLFVYSENYTTGHNFQTCDHVNLQKSHDFDLSLPISDDYHYVVIVREFYGAVLSFWDLAKIRHNDVMGDTTDEFVDFYNRNKEYFTAFNKKWYGQEHGSNVQKFQFEKILESPSTAIRSIASMVVKIDNAEVSANNGTEEAYRTFDLACSAWSRRDNASHKHWNLLNELCDSSVII